MTKHLLLGIFAAGGLVLASNPSKAGTQMVLDGAITNAEGSWRFIYDEHRDKILQLRSDYPTPVGPLNNPITGQGPSNAVYAATQFLYGLGSSLTHAHLDLTNGLVIREVIQNYIFRYPERGTDYTVVFKQQYGGFPVYEGECRVSMNNHYEIWSMNNDLQEITCPPQTPMLSEAEAFARVLARYTWVTPNDATPGSLFYFSPSNLVWAFKIPSYGSLAKIDAVTGIVVGEDPNVVPEPGYTVAGIAFNNFDLNHPVYYLETNRFAGDGCYVEVLGGPDPTRLQPMVSYSAGASPVMPLIDGWFDWGVAIVPGVQAGAQAWFQVIAWKGEGTTNGWQNAREMVISDLFQQLTGTICINLGWLCEVGCLQFPAGLVIRPVSVISGPALQITRAGDRLTLSWPQSDSALTLEYTDSLAAPNWIQVAETPVSMGNESVVTITITESARCFRLRSGH